MKELCFNPYVTPSKCREAALKPYEDNHIFWRGSILDFARVCLYNLGKIDAAVKELDIASENPKTKNESLALLETIWKKRVSQNPKDPIAQMNLGAIYQNKKEYDLAMIQYKNAEAIAPHNATLKLNMATLMQEKGNYAEALEMYNNILKANPDNITVKMYKAATLDKMGRKDEADKSK